MKWDAVLKELKEGMGIISPKDGGGPIAIPFEYLPKGCRVGDVLNFKVSFDPYSTLSLLQKSQGEA